jgi:hypothetical protein
MYYMVPYKTPVGRINGWIFPAPLVVLSFGLSQKASKKSPKSAPWSLTPDTDLSLTLPAIEGYTVRNGEETFYN